MQNKYLNMKHCPTMVTFISSVPFNYLYSALYFPKSLTRKINTQLTQSHALNILFKTATTTALSRTQTRKISTHYHINWLHLTFLPNDLGIQKRSSLHFFSSLESQCYNIVEYSKCTPTSLIITAILVIWMWRCRWKDATWMHFVYKN